MLGLVSKFLTDSIWISSPQLLTFGHNAYLHATPELRNPYRSGGRLCNRPLVGTQAQLFLVVNLAFIIRQQNSLSFLNYFVGCWLGYHK